VYAEAASAAGLGLFVEYARDIAAPGGDLGDPGGGVLGLLDRNEVGVGLAADSNLARDELLNFRLALGFHASFLSNPLTSLAAGNGYGGMLDGTLGFGLARARDYRVWLGPSGRVNADWYGETPSAATDFVDVQLGVGPKLGMNFHAGDGATVSLAVGYHYKWGWFVFPDAPSTATITHRDHAISVSLTFFARSDDDSF
jgi:hypothetical protein